MGSDSNPKPSFRVIDMNAEVKKMWGPEWNKPEVSYEFSNGRKFELKTEDAYSS